MVPLTFRLRTVVVGILAMSFAGHALAALPSAALETLRRYKLPASSLSVYIRDLDSGAEILSYNADTPRNPASTMKIITGLAALSELGPAYRWKTRVFASAEPVDGHLDGDLIIVGSGDPYLVEERLYLLVKGLRQRPLLSVDGDLIVDDSLFVTPDEDRAEFDNQPFRVYNALPSAALSNFNTIRFLFAPDAAGAVAVQADPDLQNLTFINRLRAVNKRCRGYRRGISVLDAESAHVAFEGRFPARCRRYALSRSVMPAWLYTGDLVALLFERLGGEVAGQIRRGELPDDAILLREHESLSLAEVVRLMNKHSSNLIARQLLLTMAAEANGPPATEADGVALLNRWLLGRGLDFAEFQVENGAGRSRSARISARHLVDVIDVGFRSAVMPEFLASMALYGEDGTLADRDTFPALAGRAHLKTGSLDHVTALAGVYHAADGARYALAILQNADGAHRGGGQAAQDHILKWLGSQNHRDGER